MQANTESKPAATDVITALAAKLGVAPTAGVVAEALTKRVRVLRSRSTSVATLRELERVADSCRALQAAIDGLELHGVTMLADHDGLLSD